MTYSNKNTIPLPVNWQDHISDFLLTINKPSLIYDGKGAISEELCRIHGVSRNLKTGRAYPFQQWHFPLNINYLQIPAQVRVVNNKENEEDYANLLRVISQFLAYGMRISKTWNSAPASTRYAFNQYGVHPEQFRKNLLRKAREGVYQIEYNSHSDFSCNAKRLLEYFPVLQSKNREISKIILPLSTTSSKEPFKAIKRGDLASLKNFIDSSAEVDMKDEHEQTLIQIAVRQKQNHIVNLLIKHQADVNASSSSGWTALMSAAMIGSEELLTLLLKHGAHIDASAITSQTALGVAIVYGHDACVRLLLNHRASLDLINEPLRYTSLMFACTHCRSETIKQLIALGADVNVMSQDQMTALRCAEAANRLDLVALLRTHGAVI